MPMSPLEQLHFSLLLTLQGSVPILSAQSHTGPLQPGRWFSRLSWEMQHVETQHVNFSLLKHHWSQDTLLVGAKGGTYFAIPESARGLSPDDQESKPLLLTPLVVEAVEDTAMVLHKNRYFRR